MDDIIFIAKLYAFLSTLFDSGMDGLVMTVIIVETLSVSTF